MPEEVDMAALERDHRARTERVGAPFRRERDYRGRFMRVCKSGVALYKGWGCPIIYCYCEYPRRG